MLSITNKTRRIIPKIQFERIKNNILGRHYELSLVFCGNTLSKKLNRIYRKKDKVANVLSFPISKNSGEIFVNLKKTKEFPPLQLFVHGLLHLKGIEHGSKMEEIEKKLINKWHDKS